MSCSDCAKTDLIPECTLELVVGDTAFNNILMHIFIQDIATGRIETQEKNTNVSGAILVDLTKPSKDFYKSGKDYELWATPSLLKLNKIDAVPFTISGDSETVTCVLIKFAKVYKDGALLVDNPQATLKRVV